MLCLPIKTKNQQQTRRVGMCLAILSIKNYCARFAGSYLALSSRVDKLGKRAHWAITVWL